MKNPAVQLRRGRAFAALPFALLSPLTAFSQSAQKTPPTPPEEEVVQLSPFQVTADEKGYQAFNTLSGTRLNSKLEDLGSSITVVTKQQMEDTASLDINDVFRFEASTEGTANFTQYTPNRAGGVGDNIAVDPARANRIRGVGSARTSGSGVNNAWGNFSSNSKIPFDLYNIESVEISRGPNSNLFGLGASAGTVNLVPAQANPRRSTSQATFRVDSFGGHRASLSLNRPLITDKLAVKVAAVRESKGFTREPSSERIHREYGAIFAQPFKNTTIPCFGRKLRQRLSPAEFADAAGCGLRMEGGGHAGVGPYHADGDTRQRHPPGAVPCRQRRHGRAPDAAGGPHARIRSLCPPERLCGGQRGALFHRQPYGQPHHVRQSHAVHRQQQPALPAVRHEPDAQQVQRVSLVLPAGDHRPVDL